MFVLGGAEHGRPLEDAQRDFLASNTMTADDATCHRPGRAQGLRRCFGAVPSIAALSCLFLAATTALPAQETWPFVDAVERLDLDLDASAPPLLRGKAKLKLRAGASGRLNFLLNRGLSITATTDQDGKALVLEKGPKLAKGQHEEAREHSVVLADGVRAVHIEYSGTGANELTTKDWMGILLLANDEIRMSKQTAFYPQIPLDADGPAVATWPSGVRVLVPGDFEAHVSGRPVPSVEGKVGARAFAFVNERPSTLSFVAGRRVRREAKVGDALVVVLLDAEHAALAGPLVDEVERVLAFYGACFGAIGSRTLGIVEMHARAGTSYNWSAEGLITLERGSLANGLPTANLAHEVAHLWWGQEVTPNGRGERFLTESLAEYSSWRYLEHRDGSDAVRRRIAAARRNWLAAIHRTGKECGLLDVGFATTGYQTLAYDKGPLALWGLHARIGRAGVDAALQNYRKAVGARQVASRSEAEEFVAALRSVEGGGDLDLSALELGGHAHFELGDVHVEGTKATLVCRTAACPKRMPVRNPASVVVGVWTANGMTRETLRICDDVQEIRSREGDILAIELDPDRSILGAELPVVHAPAQAPEVRVPRDAEGASELGPLAIEVRFARRLESPGAGFLAAVREAIASPSKEANPLNVVRAELGPDGTSLMLTVDGTLPAAQHLAVLQDSLRDDRGGPLPPVEISVRTRTLRDSDERPRLVRTVPASDATDIALDLAEIRFEFSMPMRSGRGFARSRTNQLAKEGWLFPALGTSSWIDEKTLVWKLAKPLEGGTQYALPIGTHYRNRLGIGLTEGETVLRFKTRD